MTEIKRTGYSWRELEKKAQERRLLSVWKTVVSDLVRLVDLSYNDI